jgi:hypothetical protein
MNPVHILAWVILAAIALPIVFKVLAVFLRLWLHYLTRNDPPERYQRWVSPGGQSYWITRCDDTYVVATVDANNLGGVHYSRERWAQLVRERKLALITD